MHNIRQLQLIDNRLLHNLKNKPRYPLQCVEYKLTEGRECSLEQILNSTPQALH